MSHYFYISLTEVRKLIKINNSFLKKEPKNEKYLEIKDYLEHEVLNVLKSDKRLKLGAYIGFQYRKGYLEQKMEAEDQK